MTVKDILMPICRPWTDRIFAGEKPFEFRNRVGTYWGSGSKIFIYESKRNSGAGMVVGKAVIDEIIPIPMDAVGPPRFLLRYWAEWKRPDMVPLLDELGDYELPGYKKGTILRYLESPELLRKAMRTEKWLPMYEQDEMALYECEDWLRYIGLVDDYGWYWYKYALKISGVQKYASPKPLADFGIARAPQSWCYAKEVL